MNHRHQICTIAGMPRAATTFLYHVLDKHPQVFVPVRKEIDFFSVNYYRGESWYLNFFEKMGKNHAGFDISPMYFLDRDAPERILKFNPDIKVILIIRNPYDWIISFYKHMQAKSLRKIYFTAFLHQYDYKKDGKTLSISFQDHFIKKQISLYKQIFGSQLLLCDYQIFKNSPLLVLRALEKHSFIDNFFNEHNFNNVIINASDHEPFKIINILMQSKIFADIVVKLVPKRFIITSRYKLQSSKSKPKNQKKELSIEEEQIDYARNLCSKDEQYISKIFKQSSFILGNGKSFYIHE